MELETLIGGRILITKRDTPNGSMYISDIQRSEIRHMLMLNGQVMITVYHMTRLNTTSHTNSIFM